MPIFASPDLAAKKRVVLVVGESLQDLGVLAYRVIGGPGGVDHGSMVSLVRQLLASGRRRSTPRRRASSWPTPASFSGGLRAAAP